MKPQQHKPRAKKEQVKTTAKVPRLISTDSALLAASIFAYFLHSSSPEFVSGIASSMAPLGNDAENSGGVSEADAVLGIKGINATWEGMKPLIENTLFASGKTASLMLARVLWLERIYKRLDLKDPKHVVTLWYCMLRAAPKDEAFKKVKKQFKDDYGEYWVWSAAWQYALSNSVVRKRWEQEKEKGNLRNWQEECQDYGNNYWKRKREAFETDVPV